MASLCTPALIYSIIAFVGLFWALFKLSITTVLVKLLLVVFWTWFLNFLCSKGYTSISWFLVILPYILILLMFSISQEVLQKYSNGSNIQIPKINGIFDALMFAE